MEKTKEIGRPPNDFFRAVFFFFRTHNLLADFFPLCLHVNGRFLWPTRRRKSADQIVPTRVTDQSQTGHLQTNCDKKILPARTGDERSVRHV